jgi:hypothetical protein
MKMFDLESDYLCLALSLDSFWGSLCSWVYLYLLDFWRLTVSESMLIVIEVDPTKHILFDVARFDEGQFFLVLLVVFYQ